MIVDFYVKYVMSVVHNYQKNPSLNFLFTKYGKFRRKKHSTEWQLFKNLLYRSWQIQKVLYICFCSLVDSKFRKQQSTSDMATLK